MFKTGTIYLPTEPVPGGVGTWDLSAGIGSRSYLSPDIPFVEGPFSNAPNVVLSLAGIEVTGTATQVRLRPLNVQAEEFNIYVETQGDCALSWLAVTWFAFDAS